MGLLSNGTPLTWKETKAQAENSRQHAIKQFIHRWKLVKDVTGDPTVWGDEIECTLVKFNHEQKTVKALLQAADVLKRIEADPSIVSEDWHPEYASFMLEGVPRKPHKGLADCVDKVEESFRKRRFEMDSLLKPDETLMTLGTFPLVGCQDFSHPFKTPDPEHSISGSIMFHDQAIFQDNPHFALVTRNITERRGEKAAILLPVFRDENTPKPFHDDLAGLKPTEFDLKQLKDDHIYLDGVPFGGSVCSLQITAQCATFEKPCGETRNTGWVNGKCEYLFELPQFH